MFITAHKHLKTIVMVATRSLDDKLCLRSHHPSLLCLRHCSVVYGADDISLLIAYVDRPEVYQTDVTGDGLRACRRRLVGVHRSG